MQQNETILGAPACEAAPAGSRAEGTLPGATDGDHSEEQEWEWTEQRETAALLVAQDDLSDEKVAKKLKIGRATLHRWKQVKAFKVRVDEHLDEIRKAILRFPIAKKIKRVERINRDWEELKKIQEARKKAAFEQRRKHEECKAQLTALRPERDALLKIIRDREEDRKRFPDDVPNEVAEAEEAAEREELKRLNECIETIARSDPGPLHPGQETGEFIRVVTYTKFGEKVEWQHDAALLVSLQRHEEQINKELADYVEKHDVSSGGKPIEASPPVIILRGVSMDDL